MPLRVCICNGIFLLLFKRNCTSKVQNLPLFCTFAVQFANFAEKHLDYGYKFSELYAKSVAKYSD